MLAAIGKDSRRPVRYLRLYGMLARDLLLHCRDVFIFYHSFSINYVIAIVDIQSIHLLIYKLSGRIQHMARLLGFLKLRLLADWPAMQGYSRKLTTKLRFGLVTQCSRHSSGIDLLR